MSLTNRVWTIVELLCNAFDKRARSLPHITRQRLIVFNFGNNSSPKDRNSLYSHLLTTVTHKIRSVFNDITILISHSHTINIDIRLGSGNINHKTTISVLSDHALSAGRRATIREYSSISILLNELFIIQLLVRARRHNRSAIIGETNYLVINSLTLPELTTEQILMLLTESIRAIKSAIKILKNSATSTGNIAPIIKRSNCFHSFILKSLKELRMLNYSHSPTRSSITANNRQITSTLRSSVHLQSNFNLVSGLKGIHIVSQLLSISMLSKQRSDRNLLLASSITLRYTRSLFIYRNILLTNLMTIYNSNSISHFKSRDIYTSKCQRLERHNKTIRLLTTKLNCSYVSLIRVHITTDIVAIFILLTDKIIILTIFSRKLTISREINKQSILWSINAYAYSIAKTVSQLHTISIRMRTHILKFSNIATVRHN